MILCGVFPVSESSDRGKQNGLCSVFQLETT